MNKRNKVNSVFLWPETQYFLPMELSPLRQERDKVSVGPNYKGAPVLPA